MGYCSGDVVDGGRWMEEADNGGEGNRLLGSFD
jgi:hypothetical protein